MKIFFTKEAVKQFNKLSKIDKKKIDKKIIYLQVDPFLGKKLSGEYTNSKSLIAWLFRIIYGIKEKQKEIRILSILHRQKAYK